MICGFGLKLQKGERGREEEEKKKGILPEDLKLSPFPPPPFFLRLTDFLTLRFPAACQRRGRCPAKSYLGELLKEP